MIQPTSGWRALDLREVWRYRELIGVLAWRDISVRYRQTGFGVAWVLIQPLVAMAIFSVFLGRLAGIPSDGLPYPLFVFAGLLPWLYFSNATTNAAGSLVANAGLVSKVYFPRLVIPLAAVLAGVLDLTIGTAALLGFALVAGAGSHATAIVLPLVALLAIAVALGVSLWLSALDVQYRDVRYALPFLVQVWLFATPVVYPASLVPADMRPLLGLNPMAGVVELYRWAAFQTSSPPTEMLIVSIAVTLALLVTGAMFFRRMERTFADVV